jgi:hypothetical protein
MQSPLISSLAVAAAKVGLVKQAAPPIGKFVTNLFTKQVPNLFTKQVPNLAHGAAPNAMQRVFSRGRTAATAAGTAGSVWAGGHAANALKPAPPELNEFDRFQRHNTAAQTATHNALARNSELMAGGKWDELKAQQQRMATGDFGSTATPRSGFMRFLNPFGSDPDPMQTMTVAQHREAMAKAKDSMTKRLSSLQDTSNSHLGAARENLRMLQEAIADPHVSPAVKTQLQAQLTQQQDLNRLFPGGHSPEYTKYLERMRAVQAGDPTMPVSAPWQNGVPAPTGVPPTTPPPLVNSATSPDASQYVDPSTDPVLQYRRSRFDSLDPSLLNNRY